jgi:outer membrane protein assembly factor BamB
VVALDAETGMQYWSRRFNGPIAGTALRRNDLVYVVVGDRENRVHAINVRRGRGVWSRRVGTTRVEPLLHDSLLVLAQENGDVAALLASNGTQVWTQRIGASPAIAPVAANGQLFVASTRDTLYRMDAATGQVTARLALPSTPSAPALVSGSNLLLALHSADVVLIRAEDEPRVDWRVNVGAVVLAPIAAIGGAFLTLNRDADIHRMDASGTLTRIARLGGAASASFTAVGPNLLAGRLDGTVACLDTTGQTIWEQKSGDSVIAPVAASHGALFVPLLRGHIVRIR